MKGRTARGRLRALDDYLVRYETSFRGRPVVDVGMGEGPWTSEELALAVGQRVTGFEADPERFAGIQSQTVDVRPGGFAEVAALVPKAGLIRVMNVLRGYREDEVAPAHALLGDGLGEAGVLLEGSADPEGSRLTAHRMEKRNGVLVRTHLLFITDGSHGSAPFLFRDWLPRDLRRSVRPGTAVHGFLGAWTEAWKVGTVPADAEVLALEPPFSGLRWILPV